MKTITLLLVMMAALAAEAARAETYLSSGKEITKAEAFKTLLTSPGSKLLRCQEVELSDKMTLRNKKQVRR